MKEKYCKIPKFRFNKFLESWKRLKYEDVIEVNSGKDYKHLDKGDIPVYGTGGYMLSVSEAITNKDGVGIGRKGTINKPYILKAPYWTVDTLFFCIPKNKYNLYFINAIFERTQWERFDESTGVPSLSKLTINNIQNYFPSFDEQSAIGSLFRTLDDLLSSYKDNLTNYQSLKRTMLSKMFPKAGQTVPEIRLDGFEEDWKSKQLKDLVSEVSRKIDKPLEPYYRMSIRSHAKGTFKQFVEDPKSVAMDVLFEVKANDLVVNITFAWEHAIAVAREEDDGLLVSHRFPTFVIDNADVDFINTYIKREMFRQKMDLLSPGGAGRNRVLNKKEFVKISILVPSLPEQQAIGAYFSNLDNLIATHQEKISQLEILKKKLLQDMFI
ncbi:restriction endonuclease subunit S [Streptococcus vestibularis]|uniref:restriction endonuclease subunit S n=1 Tax=Streptococcus vestibularis TaxID=1343 RepID=UPI00200087E1|nr:restriction endonuclease subunit S [Streptococcus vestibularis]